MEYFLFKNVSNLSHHSNMIKIAIEKKNPRKTGKHVYGQLQQEDQQYLILFDFI